MQLQIPTSSLGNFHYIDRFDDILKLALIMKCNFFYIDSIYNKLYGFYEEAYSIIELDIPFKVNESFFFGGTKISTAEFKDMINNTKTYFFIDQYPYCLFPENRRADIMNNNIFFDYSTQTFVDRITGMHLADCIVTINSDDWFKMRNYLEILALYRNRQGSLGYPIRFENMHENETVLKVISSKISQGTEILTLRTAEKTFSFYTFKSLFGPLTRADLLDIYIQEDFLESNKFAVTFSVTKKKALKSYDIPELTSLKINTHVMMLNLS